MPWLRASLSDSIIHRWPWRTEKKSAKEDQKMKGRKGAGFYPSDCRSVRPAGFCVSPLRFGRRFGARESFLHGLGQVCLQPTDKTRPPIFATRDAQVTDKRE